MNDGGKTIRTHVTRNSLAEPRVARTLCKQKKCKPPPLKNGYALLVSLHLFPSIILSFGCSNEIRFGIMNPALRLRNVGAIRVARRRLGHSADGGALRPLSSILGSTFAVSSPSSSARKAAPCTFGLSTTRSFHSSPLWAKEYPEHIILPMPALSPTMEVGTISKWLLQEGDSFGAGSVICSVETDKATMDFEAQDEGVLAKILKEGPTAVDIPVGTPVAVVVEDAADVAAFADFVLEETAAAASSAAAPAAAEPASSSHATDKKVAMANVLLPSARFLAESK